MTRSAMKNWLLLALCGLLNGTISAAYLGHAKYGFHSIHSGVLVGELTLAGGICMLATGVGNNIHYGRLLFALSGLACTAVGLLLTFWKSLTFRTVAFFVVIMAASVGVHIWTAVRTLKHSRVEELFLKAAEVVSIFFASIFSAFLFHWITLDPRIPDESLGWLGFFFGFCAIYTLSLLLRTHVQRGTGKSFPPPAAGCQSVI